MSSEFVIDTYAWIEYYLGDNTSLKLLIENKDIATPALVIAELSDKFTREKEDFSDFFKFISSRSKIIPLTSEIALEAGKFKSMMRKKHKQFGLADSIIYLTSKLSDAKLVSGDPHFKGLEKGEFI